MAAVGVAAAGVVAHDPAEHVAAADGVVGPAVLICKVSRFSVALNDSARLLSALVSTAPMDWMTPRSVQSRA